MVKYKVYIKKILEEFPEEFFFQAYKGFNNKGEFKIIFFEDILEIPANTGNIVISYIEDTLFFLKTLGINLMPINIPDELIEFTNRKIEVKSVKDFLKENKYPVFIKPKNQLKLFAGKVIEVESEKDFLSEYQEDIQLITSEVVNILSEYRVFVLKGNIIGIKHYHGDFMIFPQINTINTIINNYNSAPVSYTLDVGILENGSTVLIECNDGWAVDSYGLDSNLYTDFLFARWKEITQHIG